MAFCLKQVDEITLQKSPAWCEALQCYIYYFRDVTQIT